MDILRYSNGIYKGKIKDNKRNGEGIMRYTNGDVFKGNWNYGKRQGKGKMTYANGDIYEGSWANDKKEGFGEITINGIKYPGTWINDIQQKIQTIKSVKIKDQEDYSTCWAHSISRTFVRTLQILGVCESEYSEHFYLLFFTILVENRECTDIGGFHDMVYLFNYLKNNYETKIFDIKKSNKCIDEQILLTDELILNLPDFLRNEFIGKLKYLFDKDILFLAIYEYDVDVNGDNKPTKAIKTMLDYRLQPCVEIFINEYLNKIISKQNNQRSDIFPLVPIDHYIEKHSDYNCIYGIPNHGVNLRRWKSNGVEFKNSWGEYNASRGNFSVPDLKYLICKKKDGTLFNTIIQFEVLMFDYNKLNDQFKEIVDNNINLYYQPTIDNSLVIKENNNYEGFYNEYGFLNGECELKYNNKTLFRGNLINGIRYGKGFYKFSDVSSYNGDWVNNKVNGKGVYNYADGSSYDGDWIDNKRYGKGIMYNTDGSSYNGDWVNNKVNGKGIYNYADGSSYNGDWIDNKRYGKGFLELNNKTSYYGDWIDNKKYGRGVFRWPDKSNYDGNFINDIANGTGVYQLANGNIYEGEFKDNKFNGKGKMTYKNKEIYEGNWKDNKRDGSGKMIYYNGDIYNGSWLNDIRNGGGEIIYANGTRYNGVWKDDDNIELYSSRFRSKYLKYKKKYLELKSKL